MEGADAPWKLRPEQFRAKMVMFSFGNALAHAHTLYGVRIHKQGQAVCEHTVVFNIYLTS